MVLIDLNENLDSNTIITGDINISLSLMDTTKRQKVNKETAELLCIVEQIDLSDIYKTFHPTIAEYTFFSSVHGTFCRVHHVLNHEVNLNYFFLI